MINTVFKVIGYEIKTPEGNFVESCVFWVYAKNEEDALNKSISYKVKKTHYQVIEVIEKIENVSP